MYALEDPELSSSSPGLGIKVSYYPDIDEMAYALERNSRRYKLPPFAQFGLFAFLFLNMAGLPFVMFVFDMVMLSITLLAANIIFGVFVLPRLLKTDYKRYVRTYFGDIENWLAEVELTEEGIWSRQEGDFSFHRWEHVHEIEDTGSAVHLYIGPASLSIPSSAFAYREQQTEFAKFAYSQSRAAKAPQLTK